MAISLTKDDLKFGNGITGNVNIDLQGQDPTKPLDPSTAKLLKASFGVAGGTKYGFGPQGQLNLSIDAGTSVDLTPYFKSDSALDSHGVSHFFEGNPDKFILALDIAAHGKLAAAGSYRYGVLSADASIEAGASGELWFCRPYDRQKNLGDVIRDFFGNFRSPANLVAPPLAGESIYYEFDGYLKLAADISAGYEMKGTPNFSIAGMLLSEHYDFSILGKLGVASNIAGSYSVQVTGATDPKTGNALADWARVVVNKKHSSQLSFAADVTIGLTADTQGLPGTASEFLGALLGTNSKNWLNWAQKVLDNSDPETLKKTVDGLSEQFIGKWVGKAFDELEQTDLSKVISDAHLIATSHEQLDTTAINIFDKYFSLGEAALTSRLQQLQNLLSLADLANMYQSSPLTGLIEELTGGDPLSWIAGQAGLVDSSGNPIVDLLGAFNKRVNDALGLLQSDAHALIKKWITLAKSEFGIDKFMQQLSTLSTWTDLKKLADDKLNAFVERIMGTTIDNMDRGLFATVLGKLHNIADMEAKIYKAFTDALQQTATLSLHAEYSRSSETDALVDVELNLSTDTGRQLLRAASIGDFSRVLRGFQPGVVRILGGKLHSALTRQNILTFNVAGWHHEFNYLSSTTLLTSIDQNIVPGDNGSLTVFTTIAMSEDRVRKANLQEMHSNFMLRVLGESHGTIVDPPSVPRPGLDCGQSPTSPRIAVEGARPRSKLRQRTRYQSSGARIRAPPRRSDRRGPTRGRLNPSDVFTIENMGYGYSASGNSKRASNLSTKRFG